MALDAPTPDRLGATPAWEGALEAYARELSTGGASAATLRAYGRDLAELADWASARGREPGELAYRDLRATPPRSQSAAGENQHRPQARCGSRVPQPPGGHRRGCGQSRRPAADAEARLIPPASAGATRWRRCSTGSRRGPRSRCATARCSSFLPCGLRAEEIVSVDLGDVDFDSEAVRVTGKGQKTRLVPIGEPAQRALRRYSRRRVTRSGPPPRSARCSSRAAEDGSRPPTCGADS